MDEEGRRRVGQICRSCRDKKGWTQQQLAEIVGLSSFKEISNIEKGKITIPTDRLVIFADIFGVSTDYLLGRTPKPNFEVDPYGSEKSNMLKELFKTLPELDVRELEIIQRTVEGFLNLYNKLKT